MLKRLIVLLSGSALVLGAAATPTEAGIKVYEKEGKYVEIGGRLQLQYHRVDPDGGDSTDEIFFRRLRPYIAGSASKNWVGKFQFDIGKASGSNEVAVKDAYLQYRGFEGVKLTLGNQKPPFSREFLTSSKRQQLIERSFTGDHNFGSPDRMIGLRVDGANESRKLTWAASFGSAAFDPDAKKMDFDSPANNDSDFNEGWLAAGRIDFHPLGKMKFDQGSFDSDTKFTLSLGAFSWSNDDDNNTFTSGGVSRSSSKADLDRATGFELSGGFRSGGLSLDGEYQLIEGDTVDGSFTGGLYRSGTTELDIFALEGGYIFNNRFEVVAGFDGLDADNYPDAWTRTSFGVNYFWNKHKVKGQLSYRIGENLGGVEGADANEAFLQFQFVF
ncbi:MAG: OprO/OprP family phosphate-selective porin [Deltaproteobacteria bacterium]|nr:OprO/OprP family phosphate-selective porin [Deltaproteobacteria bacterium]